MEIQLSMLQHDADMANYVPSDESISTMTTEQIGVAINAIKNLVKRVTLNGAIQIGRYLAEVKRRLPHGEWSQWLADNVDYSVRTAQQAMQLAEEYGHIDAEMAERLSYSSAVAMIGLTDSERAAIMESVPEDASVREIKEAVKRLEQEKADMQITMDDLMGAVEEANARAEDAIRAKELSDSRALDAAMAKEEAEKMIREAAATESQADARITEAQLAAQQAQMDLENAQEKLAKAETRWSQLNTDMQEMRQKADERLREEQAKREQVDAELMGAKARAEQLERELEEARQAVPEPAEATQIVYKDSPETLATLEKLRGSLATQRDAVLISELFNTACNAIDRMKIITSKLSGEQQNSMRKLYETIIDKAQA